MLDVSHPVTFIETAGSDVPVFKEAHVSAAYEALTKENVVEPIIEIWHASLFCDASKEGTIHVYAEFPFVFLHEVVDSVPNPLILPW